MRPEEARRIIHHTLVEVAPDVDVSELPDEVDFRDYLELNAVDFLVFLEKLSARVGFTIDGYDYRDLRSVDSTSQFIAAHSLDQLASVVSASA